MNFYLYEIEYICNVLQLTDDFEERLKNIEYESIDQVFVRLICILRSQKHIISIQRLDNLFKEIGFCSHRVFELLKEKDEYIEANYEHLVNPYLYELNLNFKEASVAKAIIATCMEYNIIGGKNPTPFAVAALYFALKLCKDIEDVTRIHKVTKLPLAKIKESIRQINVHKERLKGKWVSKNTYALHILNTLF